MGHVLTASGDGWWWSLLVADQLTWVDGFYLFICFLICEGLVSSRDCVCQGCDLLGGGIYRELGQLPSESFWRRVFCWRIYQGSVPWYSLVALTIFQTGDLSLPVCLPWMYRRGRG